ncbi:MAG TPA: glycosyltransferase family 39 protein [Stellaceae bacterium]|nr:glycosyltransferase family 39 protein [Stellaceae bacterium]
MIAAASRGWIPYGLLLVLCLGLYLPGLASLPVMDRDEARFAQATRQMLESGDYLRIRFQDEARNKKPAGIYWLQAASVAALSDAGSSAIWPYRVPSFLGALGAVLLTFAFGARLVGREAALLGAALLASSLALTIEAHLAKTDAVLLFACVAAQFALGAIYVAARRGGAASPAWALLFWVAQGAAILVKGPVAPALSLLTAASLAIADRDWRWLGGLKPLWGVPLLAALVAPWLVGIGTATNGAFFSEALGHDFLGKLFGAQEGHGAWPGYYLVLVAVIFWPGSILLGGAAALAWRERRDPVTRFLAAWAVPFWIVLELTPTKLPHYLLPVFPALALFAGRAALEGQEALAAWARRGACAVWAAASLVVVATLGLAPIELGRGMDAAGIVVGAVVLLYGGATVRAGWRALEPGLAVRAVLLALLTVPAALALEAPRLDPLWLSRDAARLVERYRPPPGVAVAAVGYSEPSLVFLLGTGTLLASPEIAAQRLTSARGAVALVEARDDAAFRTALQARGWEAQIIDRIAGLDYSNGKRMVITLYRGVPG